MAKFAEDLKYIQGDRDWMAVFNTDEQRWYLAFCGHRLWSYIGNSGDETHVERIVAFLNRDQTNGNLFTNMLCRVYDLDERS